MIAKTACALVTAILVPVALAAVAREVTKPSADKRRRSGEHGKGRYEYVGTKKCRMCHVNQYHSWLESPKADSWKALKPGVSGEIKRRAGLEVDRDYTTDARCLTCHAVGFGEPGGYEIPEPGDDRAVREAEARQGAGCEACHGPGSGFVKVMEDIYLNDRTYRPEEVYAAGRKKVRQVVCTGCHNQKAICMSWVMERTDREDGKDELHVAVTNRSGYHAAFPLKHRESNQRVRGSSEADGRHDEN